MTGERTLDKIELITEGKELIKEYEAFMEE